MRARVAVRSFFLIFADMNRKPVFCLFLFFLLAAVWTSVHGCRTVRQRIADDLSSALQLTRDEGPCDWLSADTVGRLRSHIRTAELRDGATLSLAVAGDMPPAGGSVIVSRPVAVAPQVVVRAGVVCSAFRLWQLSDRGPSALLMGLAMLCMALSLTGRRAPRLQTEETVGVDALRLTPMQEQLLNLFLAAPRHELTKEEICAVLWPGKPDASDTLYTLIRRLRDALQRQGTYSIESERGRLYRLLSRP